MAALSRAVTIAEAARLTGLSTRAIEARIERGTLEVERQGRRRMVPLTALYASGLLRLDAAELVGGLLDRLEAQARRIAELEAENRRLKEDR